MRAAIRQILIDTIPDVQGRVYEPHVAGPTTKKPFIVLREGVQDPEADWAAFSTIVEVWPYVARTTFQQVDALANAIINALHRLRFAHDGEQYLVDYLGTSGPDFTDTDWDANTRGLRFRVFALGWLSGQTFEPDPVQTLREWTEATWPEAHTDPATWSPTDVTPGIYWRLVRLQPVELTAAVTWLQGQINAHILAPSSAVRLHWVRQVTETVAVRRRLTMSDGGPLEFLSVAADSEADPMRRGQVQLTVRFGVLQPEPQYELLRRVYVETADGVKGGIAK